MAISRICSIPDCGKGGRIVRGLCTAHYKRLIKHGDPLGGGVSKAPKGEAPRFYRDFVVPHDGNECLIWPYARSGHGYGQIRIDGRLHYVHRLVCEQVNGSQPSWGQHAAHSCGNGHLGCVNPKHLRWATAAENAADKVSHGTIPRGNKHGRAKLSEGDVRTIRSLIGTALQKDIAAMFGVEQSSISNIRRGRNWGHLE